MSAPTARVLRQGEESLIPASELVAGDVVLLGDGDMVPADLRLIESANLKVQEASLTGESVPVGKGRRGCCCRKTVLWETAAIWHTPLLSSPMAAPPALWSPPAWTPR